MGNFEYIVNWHKNGELLKNFKDEDTGRIKSHNYNGEFAFKGFTWSAISGDFAVRSVSSGFKFDGKGPMGFSKNPEQLLLFWDYLIQSFNSNFLNSGTKSRF